MIIWDEILEQHDICIEGVHKSRLNKYIDGGKLPNKNTTVEQAELYVVTRIDNELSGTGYHCRIHIFSFPKKTEEEIPLVYRLWIGPIGAEPIGYGPPLDWWEV